MTLTLSEIWIYPIKSLGGIRLEKAVAKKKGLQHDRRWMLIDDASVAMTQRVYPQMALFKPSIDGDRITISYTKSGKIISANGFDMSGQWKGERTTARIWDDLVQVEEVNPDISEWFSALLSTNCKLIAFPEENPRPVDVRYSVNSENVSLADAYPFLVIGQSSLDDLNHRLPDAVPMNRFRPNFVFTGGTPFLEDQWRNVSIGGVRFVAVKKSDRCVITTIDQDTGEKGSEPLRTLSTYRKVGNQVYFGHNMVAMNEGEVCLGDGIIPG